MTAAVPLLDRRGALALGGLGMLAACDVSRIRRDPRRLVLALEQEVSTLDPAGSLALAEQAASRQAYQRLLRPVVTNGAVTDVVGDLAERWEWTPDRRALTFYLRPGNRFDDGSAVTSKAVAFTFDRITRQKLTASQALFWLKGVEPVAPLVVRLHIAVPLPFIRHMLWHPGLSIFNPAVADHAVAGDQGSAWLREHSAGSGPYRVASFAPREETVLRPNRFALKQPRYFNEVLVRTVRDQSSRTMQIESGDVDIIEFLRDWQQRLLSGSRGVRVVRGASNSVMLLHVNNQRPPFNDVRVRRALSLAIDRDRLIRTIYGGDADPMHGFLPPGLPGSDPSIAPLPFDPDAARRLLREAGVAPGRRITISAITDSGTPSTTTLALREMIQAVGFDVSVQEIATAARTKLLDGDFDMACQALSFDFPDPWIMFAFMFSKMGIGATNWSRYVNPALDKLVRAADKLDGEPRAALYRQAQRILLRDLPSLPILQMHWAYAQRAEIAGGNYNFSTPESQDFADMYRIA